MQHCPDGVNCHVHTIQSFNGVASGSFSAPDHEYPSWLELRLTATDSQGLAATTSVILQPQTVDLTFQSQPSGLQLARVPTLWSGPEFQHSPSLRFLATGPLVQLSPRDAGRLGVDNGDEIELSVEGERAEATALVRSAVPDDAVFVTHVELPDGPVAIRPVRSGAAVA